MMAAPIEFFFDFASPYGYVASHLIDDAAARHGRTVAWKPYMMGAVFKIAGTGPLKEYPLKGEYSGRGMERMARLHGLPFAFPEGFPHATLAPARAFYWLADSDEETARRFARALPRLLRRGSQHRRSCRHRCHRSGSWSRRGGLARGDSGPRYQGPAQGGDRRRHRARYLRLALLHRRRRAVLGLRSSRSGRAMA